MTDPTPTPTSYVAFSDGSFTRSFEIEEAGFEIRIVPTLRDPQGLGVWISELAPELLAEVLIGLLVLSEPAPGDVMLAAVRIARHMRDQNIDPGWVTGPLEHLLHALRTPTVEGDTDAARLE